MTITQETGFPDEETVRFEVGCDAPQEFTLSLHIPWWADGRVEVRVNGEPVDGPLRPSSFCDVSRRWSDGDRVDVMLEMPLRTWPMPDDPSLVALMRGPLVLAGLTEEDVALKGDPDDASSLVREGDIEFVPLHKVVDELFGIYFRVGG